MKLMRGRPDFAPASCLIATNQEFLGRGSAEGSRADRGTKRASAETAFCALHAPAAGYFQSNSGDEAGVI